MRVMSLILLLLFSSNVLADQVVQIEQGQSAPFSGYLMDKEKSIRVFKLDVELDFAKKNVEVLTYQNNLYKDQLTKNTEYIKSLNEQLVSQHSDNFWTKTLYFILGAGLTGLVAYGTIQSIR